MIRRSFLRPIVSERDWMLGLDRLMYSLGMDSELVIVFRSADPSARAHAEEARDLLVECGLSPVLLGDDAPGVPSGAWEVRVPTEHVPRAEAILAGSASGEPEPGDPSHELDMETVFDALGATAEMEALGIRSVLEANEIPAVFVGPAVYPNLRFLVRVPRRYKDRAEQVLAEARAAGPAAAEEAELAGEE